MATKPRAPIPNGLTAREILADTTPRTQNASRWVVISQAEPKVLKGGYPALKMRTYSTHDVDGNVKAAKPQTYQTTVYATEQAKRLHVAKLKVACSCDAHVFWGGEYALAKRGAADIKYGNGDAPVVRNPNNIPWACKHIAKALRQIVSKKI
jgi:hypothetical protein